MPGCGGQQLSEPSDGVSEAVVAATAASLRQAASVSQLDEVRSEIVAAVRALHSIVAALLAHIEEATTGAAEAAWPANALPSVAEVVAAAEVPGDDALLRQCLSFKLTGMSQTTRNGTEAPVAPLGAFKHRPHACRPCAQTLWGWDRTLDCSAGLWTNLSIL